MQPPNGQSKTQYVVKHVHDDLTVKSGGHLTRIIVGGAMLVFGFGIIATNYIMGVLNSVKPEWDKFELMLVLCLLGAGFAIMFTQTFLSVMHVVWPLGKKR